MAIKKLPPANVWTQPEHATDEFYWSKRRIVGHGAYVYSVSNGPDGPAQIEARLGERSEVFDRTGEGLAAAKQWLDDLIAKVERENIVALHDAVVTQGG